MKPELHSPTRSAVVFAHTRHMLASTSLCIRKFAAEVRDEYFRSVPVEARTVRFHVGTTGEDLFKAERHNAQTVTRYMDGTVKNFPADLEDAWLRAMVSPFREEAEAELAQRRGMLAVKRLADTPTGQAVGLGDLAREFGELFEALAPALADGRITEADMPHVRRILIESDDLIGAVLSLRQQLLGLLPSGPPR